jgi:uncharacterized protein YjbI with pentapeptide repeats
VSRKRSVRAPVIRASLETVRLGELEERAELTGVSIEHGRIVADGVEGIRVDEARLSRVSLSETNLKKPSWLDVTFDSCNLSGAVWDDPSLVRVELSDSKLVGARWSEAELEDVRFVGCHMSYLAFWSAKLVRVEFERCVLREADFHGADLSGVRFVECDLSLANFADAKLSAADVSSSDIQGIRIGHREVQGLVISREQAVAVAKLLGLVVEG